MYYYIIFTHIFLYAWKISNLTNHQKSLIHSIFLIMVAQFNLLDPFITSSFSSAYYIDDIYHMFRYKIKPLFLVHHIFSIIESYIALQEPYSSLNMYYKVLPTIEASVPFLNIYLITHNYGTLIFYLCTHIYFRNYKLILLYFTLTDSLILSQLQHAIVILFIATNLWWTYEIICKI